ncbi:MAG: hypothetical protein KatS3mg102_1345 [Planctomycetota bacterium]|nr:MAG: hypothetical protein KatS3mg102_1345 [Planctomycetota bacterium]
MALGFPGLGRWAAGMAAALLAVAAIPYAVVRSAARLEPASLRYVSGPEPETLDPAQATAVLEVRLLAALFEGLFRLDPATLAPVPAAARSFEVEPDARRYVFRLREGLSWSDGSELVAEDFLFAWRRAAEPATGAPLAAEAAAVAAAARAPDRHTIEIALPTPRPELPALLTLPCFLPVPRTAIARHGEGWTRPGHMVSNGPFRLERWDPGRGLRLVRNPYYHSPARLESIDALTIAAAALGEATALRLYEAGEVDLVFGVPDGALPRLRGRPDLEEGPGLGTVLLRMNLERPALGAAGLPRPTPFADARVRLALALAIEREALVKSVLRGAGSPAATLVPEGLAGYRSPPPPGGGLERARALLAEARAAGALVGPLAFELLFAASDEAARHGAEVLAAHWGQALGARVRLRPMERKAYFRTMRRRDYDMAWGSWIADYPDPENFLGIFRAHSGNNRTGFADARFEELLERARAAAQSAERLHWLAQAEARLLSLAPCAPLYRTHRVWLRRPGLEGLVANPLHLVDWHRVHWAVGARGEPPRGGTAHQAAAGERP